MPKRSRIDEKINQEIDENINKIKKIILNEREIYDKFVFDTKMHNLVIEKVKEKLNGEVQKKDIEHFKGILRNRYIESIILLHECSDNIRKLEKEHYNLVDKIAIDKQNLNK
jgi:GTP cyclohydrolase II